MLDDSVCAVCSSSQQRLQWTVKDTLLGYGGVYRIVSCLQCGTLRLSPLPPFEDRRLSFTDKYPLFDWALGRKTAVPEERIARFHPQIVEINRRHRPGRLLDVGCGDGYFIMGMEQRGWETRGIELHEATAGYARDQLGLDVDVGAEHEVEWQGPYDCITLFGVLEDVDDPAACLERCRQNLADDGLLVIQTHNIASLEARYFGADWFNIEAPRHAWHFSPRTLLMLLGGHGFRQEHLRHYGAPFVTERSIENRRGRTYPSSTIDRLTRKLVVAPAAKVAPLMRQGIMIESYCRKQG